MDNLYPSGALVSIKVYSPYGKFPKLPFPSSPVTIFPTSSPSEFITLNSAPSNLSSLSSLSTFSIDIEPRSLEFLNVNSIVCPFESIVTSLDSPDNSYPGGALTSVTV